MAKADLKASFGIKVRTLREAQRFTQDELADRIGRSVDTVSNIERGIYATRIEVAGRIAQALKVDLAELFDFRDNVKPSADREHRRIVRNLTSLLNDLDTKNLLALRDVIEASVKLTRGRRSKNIER
jgi:transcriptional regulator with XRE-family HTH domain